MRRNCAKLVTIVGTLPSSSSCGTSLARTVSGNLKSVGGCQCSSNYQNYNAINFKSSHSNSVQYSTSSHHHVPGISMRSPVLHSLLPHLRKCSPVSVQIPIYSANSRRSYSSSRSKNVGEMMNMNNRNHFENNNEITIKAQSSSSSAVDMNVNDNTRNEWTSHSHTNQQNKPFTDYFSRTTVQNKIGGKMANNCGNSNSTSGLNSTSTSSSSSPVASLFGMIASQTSSQPSGGPVVASNFTPVRTVVTSQRLVEVTRDSIMEQPKLMTKEEREEFMSVYHQLVKELLETPDMKDMEETNRWMARVLQFNVPHGKRNRGLSTALAYKYLAPEELTEDNVRLSYVLGWCVEILQAFFLVSDDIMDGSETRRGRPCWYKVDNLGLAAVNDALLLEATIYSILRKNFSDKPYYAKVMEVMHDVTYKTIFGQSLDTRTGQDRRMETYTMDRYSSIVKYKTSYYSFYLPVALAMTMCEITDPNLFQQMRKVTLEMGHFFQVQDDFLDCFGDVEVTGKIGTDIQDCKCSWLFVVAMQRCSPEQKKFLLENYGKHEPEKIDDVKKLYGDLDMEDVYHNYEEQTYNMICTHIQQMNEELPKGLFYDMLHKIYKRSS